MVYYKNSYKYRYSGQERYPNRYSDQEQYQRPNRFHQNRYQEQYRDQEKYQEQYHDQELYQQNYDMRPYPKFNNTRGYSGESYRGRPRYNRNNHYRQREQPSLTYDTEELANITWDIPTAASSSSSTTKTSTTIDIFSKDPEKNPYIQKLSTTTSQQSDGGTQDTKQSDTEMRTAASVEKLPEDFLIIPDPESRSTFDYDNDVLVIYDE